MTRWTWAYGFAGVAALLIACGDQDVPSGPTAVSTESPTAALAPARPTPNTTLKATPTASLRPTPSPSSTPTPTPTARESAALHLAEQVPWFREPPGAAGAEAARLLVELWLRDDGLGRAVAGLPWIAAAPVGEGVPTALSALRDIADADQELAMRVLGYPWVAADVLSRDE